MRAIDPIDSLLAIYDNPHLKTEARADLGEDFGPLLDHLNQIIRTHLDTVTNRSQVRAIGACVICRNAIDLYLITSSPRTGKVQ